MNNSISEMLDCALNTALEELNGAMKCSPLPLENVKELTQVASTLGSLIVQLAGRI